MAAVQVQVIIHQTEILRKLVAQEAVALDLVMQAVFVQDLQELQVKDTAAVTVYIGLVHPLAHTTGVVAGVVLVNLDTIVLPAVGQLAVQIIRKHGMYL